MKYKNRILKNTATCMLTLALATAVEATVANVTNDDNAGPGSFRAAVDAANGDASIDTIKFGRPFTIGLDSSVIFTGDQPLSIDGNRSTITAGAAAGDLFVSEGGADLAVSSLSVTGSAASGIVVDIPATATGDVSVSLADVGLLDNALEGLRIDDLDGAAAGVVLTVVRTTVSGNGNGASDHDGIRVNETGEGDIVSTVRYSRFDANGGDGLELDERGSGDLDLVVSNSSFDRNGFQDPEDLEDGIDLDERDDGTIWVNVTNVSADGNADQGLDFDEDDDGDMVAVVEKTTATGNGDSGIKIDENNDGGLTAELSSIVAVANGDDSIRVKEDNDGDLTVLVAKTVSVNNAGFGLSVEQDDAGSGTLELQQVNLSNNEDGELETEGL